MTRIVPLLCLGCSLVIGATAYAMLGGSGAVDAPVPVPRGGPPVPRATLPANDAVQTARRECSVAALDAVIDGLRQACRADANDVASWHHLAEALLERAQTRSHRRGIVVGAPVWSQVPAEVTADVDAGLDAVAHVRTLGHDDADLYRVEAGLLSQRITGIGTALQWNQRIQQALAKAIALAKDDPRLHVALGVRQLLAPRMLGHDPARALEHFEFAARELADDERPAVFAAMASYLQKKRQQAVEWLEQAVARNPNNVFARVVLKRVRRDEDDPFGRDVTDEEAAAK